MVFQNYTLNLQINLTENGKRILTHYYKFSFLIKNKNFFEHVVCLISTIYQFMSSLALHSRCTSERNADQTIAFDPRSNHSCSAGTKPILHIFLRGLARVKNNHKLW